MSTSGLVEGFKRSGRDNARRMFRVHTTRQEASFEEVSRASERVASALRAVGHGSGARIGLVLPSSLEFVVCFLGILEAGATCVPLPADVLIGARGAVERLRAVGKDAELTALIVPDVVTNEMVRPIAPEGITILRPAALQAGGRGAPTLGEPEGAELALIQYTSGSTAAPKGVALTHGQVQAGIESIVDGIQASSSDVTAQWLPLHHDMGLVGLLTGIYIGTEVHLWAPHAFIRKPVQWLKTFGELGATVYAGPNFSYARMLARATDEDVKQLKLSRWRVAFNGAEPIDTSCMQAFNERFAPSGLRPSTMHCVYGMAEATLAVTFAELDAPPIVRHFDRVALSDQKVASELAPGSVNGRGHACVGKPVRGVQVRVVNDDRSTALAAAQVGLIEIRGDSVMSHYYGRTPEESGVSADGWLSTGDLGFINRDGLYVTGRSKDLVIVNGRNFYPQDVEAVAALVPGVYQGHVVAVSDPNEEQVVVLCEAEGADQAVRLAVAVKEAVSEAMGLANLVVHVCPARALPRTTSGKFQRSQARELWNNGKLAAVPVRVPPFASE